MRIDLKMEKMSQKALERKSNKPIMEKKRRARINHCLNQLKALILEADNERSRHSKLEKADILEMTVKYLQTFRAYHIHLQQLNQIQQQQQAALGQQRLNSAGTISNSPSPPMNLQLSHLALPLQLHHQDHFQQQQQNHRQQNNHLNHLDLSSHLNQQRPTALHTVASSQMSPTWRPW